MQIEAFFDPATWTLTYVVWDSDTRDAVIIDPVLDFDPLAVRVREDSIDKLVAFVEEKGLKVHYVLDTHAHADHLTGMQPLRERLGAKIGIGEAIGEVQKVFKGLFNFTDLATDGSQWDILMRDGEPFSAGSLLIEPIHTPGHTPADYSIKIRDAVFTGDTMFMPDFGTGRCDFPGGSAEALYDSVMNKLYTLPDETRLFVGHDYQPGGRELAYQTTVGESKRNNIQLKATTTREEFVKFRTERDETLRPPKLIFQSLQVNAKAGRLPEAEDNGIRYMRLPMGVFA